MDIHDFLSRLEGVKGSGPQYTARCPAHDDQCNSLSVKDDGSGKILFHCHAGCDARKILAALGLTWKDVLPEGRVFRPFRPRITPQRKPAPAPRPKVDRGKPRLEDTYQYGDELRKLKFRYNDGGKFFTWEHFENGRWIKGRGDLEPGLFALGCDNPSGPVLIVEGEKDAKTAFQAGFAAVSPPDGAGTWKAEYVNALKGFTAAIIIPDNDAPGRKMAAAVAKDCTAAGLPCVPLDLKEIAPELPEKGDLTDLLQLKPEATEAVRKAVYRLEPDAIAQHCRSLAQTLEDIHRAAESAVINGVVFNSVPGAAGEFMEKQRFLNGLEDMRRHVLQMDRKYEQRRAEVNRLCQTLKRTFL